MDTTTAIVEVAQPPPFEVNVFYAALLPFLIFTATIMNLVTIIAFWKVPALREEPSELLILNLAFCDLLTGATVLPLVAPLYITPGHWPFGQFGCATVVFFMNLSTCESLFALTIISADRFLLVKMEYPQYMKTITRARVHKIIAIGWVFALLTVVLELSLWEKAKTIDITASLINFERVCLSPARRVQAFALSFFLSLFFFPVVLVCSLSIAFLHYLRVRLQKVRKTRPTEVSNNSSQRTECVTAENVTAPVAIQIPNETLGAKNQEKPDREVDVKKRYIKPGITLLGVVLAMAICMLPFCFYVIITESGCEQCNNTDLLYGLLLMQFSNACIDPLIYVLTRRKVRRFYVSMLKKCAF